MMYCGNYAPWDFYPKSLRHYEVQNPFSVVFDFFQADSVPGHRKQLKKWRKYAIEKQFYQHKRFGPGNLIFTYKLNLNLLEAMYLLLLEYESAWKPQKPTQAQLDLEKATWPYFPENLSDDELLEPFLAVKKIFKKYSLPLYREHLDEWFSEALYIRHTEERMYPEDVIGVYDNLKRLYSVAWLVFQRNRAQPELKNEETTQIENNEPNEKKHAVLVHPPLIDAPANNAKISWAEGLGLQEVTNRIVKEMPTVKLIVHLHTNREPFTYYLLLLVRSSEILQEHEIANKLEDKLKPMANVFIFAHKFSGLHKALKAERRFFIDALTVKPVAYRAADFVMPELPFLSAEQIKMKAKLDFNKWNVQAQDFLRGARYYKELKNYNLAAFNLNQAVESIFIAIIRAVLGYKISVHNLLRMLRISLMFTEEIKQALQLDTVEGAGLFETLRSAYSNSRYVGNYQMNEETVEALDRLAVNVLKTAQRVYDDYKVH